MTFIAITVLRTNLPRHLKVGLRQPTLPWTASHTVSISPNCMNLSAHLYILTSPTRVPPGFNRIAFGISGGSKQAVKEVMT